MLGCYYFPKFKPMEKIKTFLFRNLCTFITWWHNVNEDVVFEKNGHVILYQGNTFVILEPLDMKHITFELNSVSLPHRNFEKDSIGTLETIAYRFRFNNHLQKIMIIAYDKHQTIMICHETDKGFYKTNETIHDIFDFLTKKKRSPESYQNVLYFPTIQRI